jgi:ClpP class serine protease
LDNGLVDGIMYLDEVIDLAAKENGGGKPRVVMYRKTSAELAETYYVSSNVPSPQASQNNVTQFNMMNVNAGGFSAADHGPVFQYRWNP